MKWLDWSGPAATASVLRRKVRVRQTVVSAILVLTVGGAVIAATGAVSRLWDPLEMPAVQSELAQDSAMLSMAHAGDRLVAVGPRGHILVSEKDSGSWSQVPSPVSSDLVAVRFSDERHGWIVGHDAVLLSTSDGGRTWERRLDGRKVLAVLTEAYEQRVQSGDKEAARILREVERSMAQSAVPGVLPTPFFDVLFLNRDEGFLVGAFGLVLRTTDGGKSWQPWIDRTENERRLHLYALRSDGKHVYAAGEQGLLLKWDASSGRFVKVETPYDGTYFGLIAKEGLLVVYGLRGNAYASHDGGQQWQKVETGVSASIVAAFIGEDARLFLVTQTGQVLVSTEAGRTAQAVKLPRAGEVFDAMPVGRDRLALARLDGVVVLELGPTQPAK